MTANTKTLLTVKTDKQLKKAAQELAEELGMPLGTLVNAYLKQFVRTKEVRLSVAPLIPRKSTIRTILKSEKEYAGGKLPKFASVKELMKELRS